MSAMSYKSNSKLSLPITVSIILHLVLIAILSYKAMHNNDASYGSLNGQSIDAIMVDPSVMTEQYQRQLQNKVSQQKAEQQRQQQLDKQTKQLQEKQLAEQQRLKELEKERLKLAEQQRQEQEKLAKEAAEKAEREKEAAEKAAKEAAEKAAKEKAAKRKAAESAKNDKVINDLLGGLTSSKPNSSGKTASRKGVSDGELNKYQSLVKNAISNKFINPNKLYSGKVCYLKIQIAPDGLLLDVVAQGGDPALCREAISATKLAIIPKPSSAFYDEVKIMNIEFQPN